MKVELFGKDKKDGIKVWTIQVYMADHADYEWSKPVISITHGKVGCKLTTKTEFILEGKQGRSPLEQAVSEAQGKEKKQRDKGYRDTVEELEELPLLAMLAGDYNKIGHRIDWTKPVYGSDKLDGVRCLAKKVNGVVTLESRTGQPYDLPHVLEELAGYMVDGEVFDGELYKHGAVLQDITSAVKRTDTQGEVDKAQRKYAKAAIGSEAFGIATQELEEALWIQQLRPTLEFLIFDIGWLNVRFEKRLEQLQDMSLEVESNQLQFVKILPYTLIESEEHLKNVVHPDAVTRGFEGYMLRNADGLYESGKRSADLQKYKTFLDSEFQIVDVVSDKDGGAIFVVQNTFTDNTFQVVWGTHEQRSQWLKDKSLLTGLWLKVKYQALYKDTLKPQFPVGIEFRACDEKGNPVD